MASENLTWGAERIRGELLKLGINLSKRTIQKYLAKARIPSPSGQTWSVFLKNHAPNIWACDFVPVYDIFFRCLFVFVVIEHSSRRIVHVATTVHPTDAWVAQQLREATPWNEAPKYLIRDNDRKYGHRFSAVAKATGIEEIQIPFGVPDANAVCERFVGSLRRECLDHMLVLNHKHCIVTSCPCRWFLHLTSRLGRPQDAWRDAAPRPPQCRRGCGRRRSSRSRHPAAGFPSPAV